MQGHEREELLMKLHTIKTKTLFINLAVLGLGLVIGFAHGQSQRQPPSEHQGVSVVSLGELKESSLNIQLGLEGYVMKMREVTVEPGGAIKEHSHATRPGLVKTVSGSWIEVRGDKETEYSATKNMALVEDENTVHWLYNEGSEPAVAIVCGLAKAQ
jgi:quercetin dioxygenase-like cupin family protein